MFEIKNLIRNKLSSTILIVMMVVSALGFNIVFNLFYDAFISQKESAVFARNNKVVSLTFDKGNSNDLNDLMEKLLHKNIYSSYFKRITLESEPFKKVADVFAVSDVSNFNYKILKGRNLTSDDINNNNKVVVISEIYKDVCEEKNGSLYINIDGEEYEVVGIMGNKYSKSYFNYNIIMPYTVVPKVWNNSNIELVDILASDNVEENINIFEDYKERFNLLGYNLNQMSKESLVGNLENLKKYLVHFLVIALISIINIILFSQYWINKKLNQIAIFRAVGYSNKDINISVIKELVYLSLIASGISVAIYYPFSKFFNEKFFDIGLKSSPILFLANMFFLFVCSFLVVKFNREKLNSDFINKSIINYVNLSDKFFIKIMLVIEIFILLSYLNVFKYSVEYVFDVFTKSNKIIEINNTIITDPFSASFDENMLLKYEDVDRHEDENIKIFNYLYDGDTSLDVANMNNHLKDDYSYSDYHNYLNYYDKENIIPLLYIDKSNINDLKFKYYDYEENFTVQQGNIPVIAGYDYKDNFSIGDIIKGDSGHNYEIVGFLNRDNYMYATNNSDLAISETNNLNSFLVVPYDMKNIKEIALEYNLDDISYYKMINTLFIYKNDEGYLKINSILKDINVKAVALNNQIEKFSLINFGYIKYTLFNSIIVLIICVGGFIGFIVSMIFSDKRSIGIKIAVGFSNKKIVFGYVNKILKLILIGVILYTLRLFIRKEISLSDISIIITANFIIIMPLISLVIYMIKKHKPCELLGGEK